jgi:DNA-directed RNA polymerase subunit N (RpoN/RPB10)
MKEKLPSRCPNCGSDNLQTEPLYDYEEGPTDQLALFCVSCGRYIGEMPSALKGRMQSLRNLLASDLTEVSTDEES